ncbi:MAG: hypothetical protein IK001_00600 [Lachnospiraceae bacterium]|nr:hypothetical protein [Lachnospiraceae bacterium]
MKKTLYKTLAVVLSAALIAGTGATYYAKADKGEDVVSKIADYVQKKDYEAKLFQDETVYVINDNNGEEQKMIVVDKLKDNEDGTDTVTKKQLNAETPVKINVTYTLDGKEVKAEELAGKSGHVRIEYDYTNTQYEMMNVGGKEEKVYVPFAAVTGMLLNSDVFSNITVEGGRLVDDGSRQAVVGVVFPGLLESLGNAEEVTDKVSIPESLVIEADVKDFELGTVYTIVTNYDFDEFTVDEEGLEGSVSDAIAKATDGFEQLTDGSEQLYNGLVEAKDGSAALTEGLGAAYEGSKTLTDGAAAVNGGAAQISGGLKEAYEGSAQVNDGTTKLYAGLETLSANSDAINGGAEKVFVSLLANATKGLNDAGITVPELTIDNYGTVLDQVVAQLQSTDPEELAKAKVTAAVEANRAAVEAQVAAAVQAQMGLPDEMMASEQVKAVVAQKTEEQIEALIAQNMASDEVKAQIAQGKAQIEAGAAQIKGVKQSLDDYNTFYQGVKSYTSGVDAAKTGASQLKSGTESLNAGLNKLSTGADTLAAGTEQLESGAKDLSNGLGLLEAGEAKLDDGLAQLRDGSKALNEGLAQVNDELIGKLDTLVNVDLADLTDRLKALKQVSADYKCVDGLGDAEDGHVKFIYKNEAIK